MIFRTDPGNRALVSPHPGITRGAVWREMQGPWPLPGAARRIEAEHADICEGGIQS